MTPTDFIQRVVREDVRSIKAYPVANAAGMVKLDAMENPYRLPDAVRAELAQALAEAVVNRYPDPAAPGLKARLRAAVGVPAGMEVLLGNGSDEIITIATTVLARPGMVVLAPEPSFVMYRMSAQFAHCRYVGVPLRADFTLDIEAFLARIEELKPALVWLAYPNNPTGNLFHEDDIARIARAAPGLVVVDEAYHIFAGRSFIGRLEAFPNVMVMRTVSKIGLAGIRLGYAVGHPEWIAELDKARPPYNVSVLTQTAGDVLLRHMSVFDEQARQILDDRDALVGRLAAMPRIETFPTAANFVLVRVPDAERVVGALKARRILVRNFNGSHPLLANCLRFTVGTSDENELLLAALNEAV